VTGHTDKTPVRTVRFPSNWHLSEERAQSVKQLLLAHAVAADRVRAEGRADSEPVAPNNDPAQRAQNRRVEVTLFVGRSGEPIAQPAPSASTAGGAR
jgi:type VI secretion system protein ImpK